MPIRYANSVTSNWADGTPTAFLDDFLPLDQTTWISIPAVGTSTYSFALLYDLETAQGVDSIRVHCNGTTGASGPMFLAYSADGVNWTNTTAPATLTTTGNWQTVITTITSPSPPVNARYWRCTFTRLGSPGSIIIGDARLYCNGVEVPANPVPPDPLGDLMGTYWFSSGELVTYRDGVAVTIAAVQDINVAAEFMSAVVRESAGVNVYPECVRHHSGRVTMSARVADFSAAALNRVAGGTLTPGNPDLLVFSSGTGTPLQFDAFLKGKSCDDKDIYAILYGLKADGLNLSFVREDFGTNNFVAEAYSADHSGTVPLCRIQFQP